LFNKIVLPIFAITIFSAQTNTAHAMMNGNPRKSLAATLEEFADFLYQKAAKLRVEASESFKSDKSIHQKIYEIKKIISEFELEIGKAKLHYDGKKRVILNNFRRKNLRALKKLQSFAEENLELTLFNTEEWVKRQFEIIEFYVDVNLGNDIDFAREIVHESIFKLANIKKFMIDKFGINHMFSEERRIDYDMHIKEFKIKLKELSDSNIGLENLLAAVAEKNEEEKNYKKYFDNLLI
jgi:hypothetical protein